MSQPIVWFYHPQWVDLVNEIPSARLLIYHIVDEYTSYRGDTLPKRRMIAERERKMMAQVDAVVVVSKDLYEAKRSFNACTYLVPNGVDYQAYANALADPRVPEDLQRIPTPRLGYSGLIGDKLNFDMLRELARENPEWSLVFVGPVNTRGETETRRALQAMPPNVHYLGAVEWCQVPYYVKGFDVGLMPYIQDRHAQTISPMKLYDYLAAGLPIASMDIPAAREFRPYLHLAATPQDFSVAVRSALADTSPERREARRRVAARHTWEARVEQLSGLLQSQLDRKAHSGHNS
jgi:glycosyltransferase involved in cell wall biosynthesis